MERQSHSGAAKLPLRKSGLMWLAAVLFGCTATLGGSGGEEQGCNGTISGAGGGSAGGAGTQGSAGSAGGSGSGPSTSDAKNLLAARIRRLTNAEFDRSVQALFGVSLSPSQSFAPDTRQNGFTENDAQLVDPVLVSQLARAAENVAKEVLATRLDRVAPCASGSAARDCARTFIREYGGRAYRRALTQEEHDALLALYQAGESGGSYAEGIGVVIRGLLQSAGFLYLTELGEPGARGPVVTLTQQEIAAALAYLVTGAPPDRELLTAADGARLGDAEERVNQARRLLAADPRARGELVRAVQEWLGIDRISETSKDAVVYPAFEGLRTAMAQEARDFIDEVLRGSGNIQELLTADWTKPAPALATFYGIGPPGSNGRSSFAGTKRLGILSQAAFLSVYAHAHESSPVARGVAVLRRLGCIHLPSPSELNIMVVPPVPDPTRTTRERFAVHTSDAACRSCHVAIDGAGFSFEHFDGMGRYRTQENGRAVDSSSSIAAGMDFAGSYASSADLVRALAQSASVRACFTRQMFRFAAARAENAPEEAFLAGLPQAAQGNVPETVLAFIHSPRFVERRLSP
jgi:hypothetical protein